jgi:hypothetical protein
MKPVLCRHPRRRTRWRWKVVLRSLTVLLGAGVGTILVAAYGLEQFRFSRAAIVTARIVTYLVIAGLGWFFFVRPLARRVTDQQVALYLEEHEPSLQELLLSAVDAGSSAHPPEQTGESVAMLGRLVESAIEQCQASDLGRGLERQSLRRSAAVMCGIALAAAAIFTIGPAYLRLGALAVLACSRGRTVARGADVTVARLSDSRPPRWTSSRAPEKARSTRRDDHQRRRRRARRSFGLRQSMDYFVRRRARSSVLGIEGRTVARRSADLDTSFRPTRASSPA